MYFLSYSFIWETFCPKYQMAPHISKVSGYFLSISLSDMSQPLNYILGLNSVYSSLPHWVYGFITRLCITRLAWPWTYPAGMSTCSRRSFPLRTGGQNLISSLSISPYPVEQDAFLTPNLSGNLPTAHIWALCMHDFFRKMSSLCFWVGGFQKRID